MVLFNEHADVSVRPAIAQDARHLARIQKASWAQSMAKALGEETVAALDLDGMTEQWSNAIAAPSGQGFAVFTALAAQQIVGFAAVSPELVVAFEVDPLFQREGHGSRLLSAAVDQLRRDGAANVNVWIPQAGAAKQKFFESAGFGLAGRVRYLRVDEEREIMEERWTASLEG